MFTRCGKSGSTAIWLWFVTLRREIFASRWLELACCALQWWVEQRARGHCTFAYSWAGVFFEGEHGSLHFWFSLYKQNPTESKALWRLLKPLHFASHRGSVMWRGLNGDKQIRFDDPFKSRWSRRIKSLDFFPCCLCLSYLRIPFLYRSAGPHRAAVNRASFPHSLHSYHTHCSAQKEWIRSQFLLQIRKAIKVCPIISQRHSTICSVHAEKTRITSLWGGTTKPPKKVKRWRKRASVICTGRYRCLLWCLGFTHKQIWEPWTPNFQFVHILRTCVRKHPKEPSWAHTEGARSSVLGRSLWQAPGDTDRLIFEGNAVFAFPNLDGHQAGQQSEKGFPSSLSGQIQATER